MSDKGRPATGRTTQNVNVSLPIAFIQKLEAMAEAEHRTKSNMVSVLIQEAIKQREGGK